MLRVRRLNEIDRPIRGLDRYDFGVMAMRCMGSRFVDVDVTVSAIRDGRPSTP
jgi:hypothetical protein